VWAAIKDAVTNRRSLKRFQLGNVDGLSLELAPDFNVAPQTMQSAIIWDEEFGMRTLHMMFWRFLPLIRLRPKTFQDEHYERTR